MVKIPFTVLKSFLHQITVFVLFNCDFLLYFVSKSLHIIFLLFVGNLIATEITWDHGEHGERITRYTMKPTLRVYLEKERHVHRKLVEEEIVKLVISAFKGCLGHGHRGSVAVAHIDHMTMLHVDQVGLEGLGGYVNCLNA